MDLPPAVLSDEYVRIVRPGGPHDHGRGNHMRSVRALLVMTTLAAGAVMGVAAPAHACVIAGGPYHGRNCYFAVECAVAFAGDTDPVNLALCLAP